MNIPKWRRRSKYPRAFLLPILLAALVWNAGCLFRPVFTSVEEEAQPVVEKAEPAQAKAKTKADDALAEGVFNLKYKGLDADDQRLMMMPMYALSWKTNADTPFIKSIDVDPENLRSVPLNVLGDAAPEAVIEFLGDISTALYIDMNRNNKLDEGEKIAPSRVKSMPTYISFMTPDFDVTLDSGKKASYRCLFQAQAKATYCLWKNASAWEAKGLIGGRPHLLTLINQSKPGAFAFGRDMGCLEDLDQKNTTEQTLSHTTLSSLMPVNGQFYSLALSKDNTRAILKKVKSKPGHLSVSLTTKNGAETRPSSIRMQGAKDSKVTFYLRKPNEDGAFELPPLDYRLSYATLTYGDGWSTSVSTNAETSVKSGKTAKLQFGDPKLEVSVVDKKDRYRRPAPETKSFKKDQSLFINQLIKGKAGETFSSFSNSKDAKAVLMSARLLDADGKEAEGLTTEYG